MKEPASNSLSAPAVALILTASSGASGDHHDATGTQIA